MGWSRLPLPSRLSRALEIARAASCRSLRVERRADETRVVGLDGEDAGRRLQVGLVGDQRCRALVGRDADVLEQVGREQEVVLVGERVEGLAGLDQAGRGRGCGEAVLQVDLRPRDLGAAERLAEELHVVQLVPGDLLGVVVDGGRLEVDLLAADHATLLALARRQLVVDAVAVEGVGVELRLEVLQVEGEVEHRAVADPRGLRRGGGGRAERARTDHAETGDAGRLQEQAAVGLVLRAPVDHVCDYCLAEHAYSIQGCRCAFKDAAPPAARRDRGPAGVTVGFGAGGADGLAGCGVDHPRGWAGAAYRVVRSEA